jgi:hypothetical protein
MHLSTSSSDTRAVRQEEVPTTRYGLPLTAADRPAMAQPVPVRDIPNKPWRAMSLTVMVLVVILTSLWEWKMRSLQLVPGDLGDDLSEWAELRKKVDVDPTPLAILGDSRILLDTDLDRVQQLTGVRPVQLGLTGTSGLPILEDLAADPHFKGLAVVGVTELAYFGKSLTDKAQKAIDLAHRGSPSQRGSFLIYRELSPYLVMLDPNYRFSKLVARLDRGLRPGVRVPYEDVWKINEMFDGGQTWVWRRLEHDQPLSDHARLVWHNIFKLGLAQEYSMPTALERTKVAVDKIRARGGDVVFVRPPSSPKLRTLEDTRLPRAKVWDALLAYSRTRGVHADDLPAAQGLTLPEESHLSRACATVFTDAYIRSLAQMTPFLKIRRNAPPVLSPHNCVSVSR